MLGCGGGEGDVGKCGRKCHGAPQPSTLPYTSPIPLPTSLTPTHFPTHTIHFPHPSPHFPPHSPYLFPQLPSPPPTPQHTSPVPTHPMHSPHSFNNVAKLPRDDVIGTLINLTGLWKSSIKFFTTIGKLKPCFPFQCRQCKFSMYESVAKLLATV